MLQNNDYTVAGTVSFRADRDGTLIVGLKARDRGLVRVVSRHQAGGGSRSFLLDADGRIVCDGLAVSWHNRSAVGLVQRSLDLPVGGQLRSSAPVVSSPRGSTLVPTSTSSDDEPSFVAPAADAGSDSCGGTGRVPTLTR